MTGNGRVGHCAHGHDSIIRVVAMDDSKPQMPILMELAEGDLWHVLLARNPLRCTFKETVR